MMNSRGANWSDIKSFINTRIVSPQWIVLNDSYYINVYDGPFSLNCVIPITDPASDEQTDFETNYKSKGNVKLNAVEPFAAKAIGIKKLYKRITGISQNLSEGSNNILFTIPFPWMKITGLEVINCESLDTVSMYVLDTATGTYTTVPNFVLNQFCFNVQLPKDYYVYKSEFDADLYQNMQIKIVYTSISEKTVGVNFILNEVK